MNDRLARRDDPVTLGFITITVVAVLSCITTAAVETPRLPSSGSEWAGILLLAIICSSIGTALQPLAQRYVPSERACVFCALNPLATCIMGWIFLDEWQGMSGIAGALLILAAILISQVKPAVKEEDDGNLAGTNLRETLSYAVRHYAR